MMTGAIIVTPVAVNGPQRLSSVVKKLKIATGTVLVLLPVKTTAYKNSFQDSMKANMAVTPTPPHAVGRTTLKKVVNGEAPSIAADSSREIGRS
jgi:hypothetical protein